MLILNGGIISANNDQTQFRYQASFNLCKQDVKKEKVTYLAILRDSMPWKMQGVVLWFEDVMLLGLPKKLPPRREVNYKIELKSGATPHAKGLYRMALRVRRG